jgi:hypothetical protein
MKVKKVTIGVLLAISLVAVFSMNAVAADAWYTCTIDRFGGQTTGTTPTMYLMVTHTSPTPAFSKKYFRLSLDRYKEAMAIILTAMSSGMSIMVYGDPAIATNEDRWLKQLWLLP